MAKLFCTDAAMEVVTDAVQVLGGYGLAREFGVERMMRDAKAFQIFDGTSQIQKLIVGRYLARARVPLPERF
jgi:alkylation response protein AidB-like acyl-CoA dehydrogenase